MKQLNLVFSITFLLLCSFSVAAQTDFPSVAAFSKSILTRQDQIRDAATGDLNADRLKDWVGVIHRRPADSSPTYQLYVLLRQPQGGFLVAEKSIEEEIPGMGCCWLEGLEIRLGCIYLQNNAKDGASMEAATHRFKLHKGEWRLVGVKIYRTDHTPSAPETVDTEKNLLTGLVIEKRKKGLKRPVTKSWRKTFGTYLLKDFDLSTGFGTE